MFRSKPVLFAPALLAVSLASASVFAQETVESNISTQYQDMRLVKLTEGLSYPWAVTFLSDGRYLVTERSDGMQLIDGGEKTQVSGVPEFYSTNQGGMLDVVTHPDYADNGWIYFTYSKGDESSTVPALARARLEGSELIDVEELFTSNTPTDPGRHYGGRILFLDDGTLLLTIGDRGSEPMRAQDTMDHSGTVVRLNADGSVPEDNPLRGKEGYAEEIYSYGHRNIQGIVLNSAGQVWVTEHGPRGGDELNLVEPGKNYGWPLATLGRDYGSEGPFPDAEARELDDMQGPVYEFLPTLAPSGLAYVDSEHFPNWQGNLLAGGLSAERILRVLMEEGEVIHLEELLLQRVGRIRDVRQGPDGHIYVLNDQSDAALFRIEPAD
ncbi:MAG: PQQ-dependent sugar dehydrogenase [Pseudomonadaceae bacterium]|nr:MAG: PQQ-dependent sugar dehydrogenase [Pseudomonadaceae bacterium]